MKRTVYKIFLIFSAAVLCFNLVACSENKKQNETENATAANIDTADNEVNSDWKFGQVAMGGGGLVTGIFSTSEENLYYARTDVGGAYRWDNSEEHWVSLSYSISEADKGLLGIDGFAVDPNAPNKIYLLAGTEYYSSGKTAVMRSEDYGKTFETVEVTDMITVHGNGNGRQNGERIAVDPNDGNVIFAGGRKGGLIKSSDSGKTWAAVDSFPIKSTENGNGINGIVIDQLTGKIYAAVSQKGTENIFVSDNSGESWSAAKGLPADYMPQRIKSDGAGNIYITYGASEGPSTEGGGGIYRINVNGSVQNISPAEKCFGDIVISADDSSRLVACTESVWSSQPNGSFGDEFYISEDSGKSWRCINGDMKMSNGGADWVTNYAMHWCGSMAIDPFDANTVMVTSGNGIFRCNNIWDDSPEFVFFVKGLEETVPLDCISIPNGELFTAIGDYDGFENINIAEYGRTHTERIGTTTSIAVAGLNTDIRVKVGGNESEQKLLYTENGGDSWTYITNKPNEKIPSYNGSVAVTADGKNIIWSTSGIGGSYYTADRGDTWEKIKGVQGGYYVIADTVNPNYVYACGKDGLSVSSDCGKSFTATALSTEIGRVSLSNGCEGTIYIPFRDNGLFVTEDHGQSFTKIASVKSCTAVGTGKGKDDSSPNVIYIWGQPDESSAEGIYMSEDSGASWERINDDLHQFGGLGNGNFIVGDNNIYGRCYISTVGLGLIYCDKINTERV